MRRFLKQFSPSSPATASSDKPLAANEKARSVLSAPDNVAQDVRRSQESSSGVINSESRKLSSHSVQERIYGLTELISQPSEKSDAVDIVAIHGLNGHSEKTWVDKKTRINWLSDVSCLPKDIPNARILSYGYNSTSYFSRGDSDVRDFASGLLAALRAKRKTNAEKQRPIIFICHSLGGLVFKQLVVRGHEQDGFYGPLLEKIQGVVFLGTPHRGSDLAYWDSIGTQIVRAATLGFTTNTKLAKDLKVDSEMLKRISDSFAYRGATFKIRSFYETEFMPGLNCCVVDKDSARLGWSNELDIASPANHSGICKFGSRDDPRYETVVSEILDMIEVAEDNVDLTPFTAREKNCMRQLNSEYTNHLDQIDDPVPQTCEWILSHNKWKQWQSCQGSSLLWITLNAGCGKSVIAKFLVNYFQHRCDANTSKTLAYFFFMDGVAGQNSAPVAVSALLHQLYCSQNRLVKHAMTKFDGTPNLVFNSFSTMWAILVNSLSDTAAKDVLWILDGLDECEMPSLRQFIDSIAALLKQPRITNLKIILLSRPTNRIQHSLSLFVGPDLPVHSCSNKFRLVGENECDILTANILLFAEWKIDELASASVFSENVLTRLRERLVAGADYTFLWISLVMKMIEDSAIDGISETDLGKILQTTKIHEIYCHLLKGTCGANPAKTRRLLAILLASVRPMTVDEMCAAVEIPVDDSTGTFTSMQQRRQINYVESKYANSTQKDRRQSSQPQLIAQSLQTLGQRLHKPFDNHIRQLCGHFVRIRRGRIYFVHQTARSFLNSATFSLNETPETVGATENWEPITMENATYTLLQICVIYIKMIALESDHLKNISSDSIQTAKYLDICKKDPSKAFFLYAARHWIKHYKVLRESLNYRYDELLQPDTRLFKVWIIVHKSWLQEQESIERTAKALDTTDIFANVKHSRFEKFKIDTSFNERFDVFNEWVLQQQTTESNNEIVNTLQTIGQTYGELRTGFDNYVSNEDWILHRYRKNEMQDLVNEIQTLYLTPLRLQLEELDWQREQAFKENPGLEEYLQQRQSEKEQNLTDKEVDRNRMMPRFFKKELELSDTYAKKERDLGKVLTHFGILHMGLENDEFLREYWQPRNGADKNKHRQMKGEENNHNPENDENEDNTDEELEESTPNWVKHYAHTRIEAALSLRMDTPGASRPELSSFKPRFLMP